MTEKYAPSAREQLRQELVEQIKEATQGSIYRAVAFTRRGDLTTSWSQQCQELAHDLLSGNIERSFKAGQTVLTFAFQGHRPPASFWSTSLGQQVWAVGVFPPGGATRSEAAALLGTSQQNVSYLIGKYRLVTTQTGQVEQGSLMRWWATHPTALNHRTRKGS